MLGRGYEIAARSFEAIEFGTPVALSPSGLPIWGRGQLGAPWARGRLPRRPALQGYAAIFRKAYPYRGILDYIAPGAFAASLRSGAPVFFLRMHDREETYGSTEFGNLELIEDDRGLAFRLRLIGDQKSLALAEEVRGGRLSQMSIGINVLGSETRTIAGQSCRVVKAAELVEISAVATGAIRETTVELVDLSKRAPFESEVRTGRLAYDFAATHFVRNLAALARAVGPQ